jgi:hypothetical protein
MCFPNKEVKRASESFDALQAAEMATTFRLDHFCVQFPLHHLYMVRLD